jgi:uncharacterized protein
MARSRVLTAELVGFLRSEFQLDWTGIHGAAHWARVRYSGLLLARENGAITRVVEIFAFMHDVRRESDGGDPLHGTRGADLAGEIHGRFFELPREELRLLEIACRDHSDGYTEADITVQTCWDADRLDLGRVGIEPDPQYLCTDAAKRGRVIDEAYRRSVARW